ncbi:hypothetical protein V8V91_22060 [Algoriphagus halophilus]
MSGPPSKMIRVDNDPSLSPVCWITGVGRRTLSWSLSSRASRCKTAMWNAVTDRSEKNCLAPMYLILWMRSGKSDGMDGRL